jgi:hypothetical protein
MQAEGQVRMHHSQESAALTGWNQGDGAEGQVRMHRSQEGAALIGWNQGDGANSQILLPPAVDLEGRMTPAVALTGWKRHLRDMPV